MLDITAFAPPPLPLLQLSSPATLYLRGGGAASAASLINYAAEASGLFGNMGGTAAFLAGGLVPLSSFAAPKVSPSDHKSLKRLKQIHYFCAIISLVSNLIAVMYATTARNMLAETVVAPTTSLKALLLGEYALFWTGCNAHFIFGLCGFAVTLGIDVWLGVGGAAGRAVACGVSSAVLLMISIVNTAVTSGDTAVGGSVLSIFFKYGSLLLSTMWNEGRILVFASFALAVAAAVLAVKAVMGDHTQD